MPIYLYECPECGLEVERIQKSLQEANRPICSDLKEDEECGSPDSSDSVLFDRKVGRPNAHFRGDGFHSTDYDDSSNPASNNN